MEITVKLFLLLAKCSVLFADFTRGVEVPVGRITGGHEASPHSRPYIVSLQTRFFWVRTHICGGALLNENWILTAGHCVKESWLIRLLPLDAVAGIHDVDTYGPKGQVVSIDKRIPHPLYKGGIGPNDIAMLKTKTPFILNDQVQPINLPKNNIISPQPMTLAGWGILKTTFFIPALPSKLQEVDVTYMSYEDCYTAIENIKDEDEVNPLDRNSNICSGPITGGIAACSGDSGGPLIQYTSYKDDSNDPVEEVTQENEEFWIENNEVGEDNKDEEILPVVVGVVSWGATPCGEKGAPTVYTKVSSYIDFIKQYIDT